MAEFLVECYVSRTDGAAAADGSDGARRAAAALTEEGTEVRFLRSIFVPEDETCFYLFEATSVDTVREAAARAGLTFGRVAAAVAVAQGEGK
ncbi:MAG: nickel-binding protein [Candidatus Limnocylindrales bacterium]